MSTRQLRAVAAVFGGSLVLLAGPLVAQTVSGKAFTSYSNVGGVVQQSPVATLPAEGGMATGESELGGSAVTTGAADSKKSGSQSTSELENVSVAGGAITAGIVTAVSSSWFTQFAGGSDANGSGFTDLVVNGTAISTDVAPNTRVDLPGVGYAVLNEQIATGNGVTSWGITVNMIHVVLQDGLTGLQTGEIIIGSASSSVTR